MDILQREDMIKGLPDAVLFQKAQETGADQFLFVSEIQRRQKMRDRYAKSQSDQPEETIVEQILSGGIAEVGQPNKDMQAAMLSGMPPPQPQGPPMGMPPQGPPMGMPPQGMPPQGPPMGMAPQGMPPQGMPMGMPPQGMPPQGMPMGMAPQGMASGGVVRMAEGRGVAFPTNTPHLLENQNHNVPVLVDKAGQPSMKLSSAITVDGRRGSLDRELLDLALADKTPTETVKRDVMANTPRQEMASGGVVRMYGGRGAPYAAPTGETLEERVYNLMRDNDDYANSQSSQPEKAYSDQTVGELLASLRPTMTTLTYDEQLAKVAAEDAAAEQQAAKDRASVSSWLTSLAAPSSAPTVGDYLGDAAAAYFIKRAAARERRGSGPENDDESQQQDVEPWWNQPYSVLSDLRRRQRPSLINIAANTEQFGQTPSFDASDIQGQIPALKPYSVLSGAEQPPTGGALLLGFSDKNPENVGPPVRRDGAAETTLQSQPPSYTSLAERMLAEKRPNEGVDYIEAKNLLREHRKEFDTLREKRRESAKPVINYKEHALDYGKLITEQESRARKIREDAKKSAGAQALIHLGAGIAEGDLAKGLRGAAESASETTRLGRQEATAEERLARTMQIAEAESNMDLGIRQQESALAQYENDRTRALEEFGIEGEMIRDQVGLEMKAAEMKYAETVAAYEAKRDQFISAAQMLYYGDLGSKPMEDQFREAMRTGAANIKATVDAYIMSDEGRDATPAQLANFIKKIMDDALATYGGDHPQARDARDRQKALATRGGYKVEVVEQ